MKFTSLSLAALSVSAINARFIEEQETNQVILNADQPSALGVERFLIETAPGESKWMTEEDKWELRRNGINFMDITGNEDLATIRVNTQSKPSFPAKMSLAKEVKPLISNLSASNMKENLVQFSGFHTRYYKSAYGQQSSQWLLAQVNKLIKQAGAEDTVFAEHFAHPWGQNSVIATIPGRKNSTVVVGAHQDSINLFFPSVLSAPGADDDGSGTVTILEAFRVLLSSSDVIKGKAENTVEFHWYSAEEGGLLGSQAIFKDYANSGRDVKAMLQQDMTGYISGTTAAGKPVAVGVITDFVDPSLTLFIKEVITEYCSIPYVDTKCGYACSDHASASKAGYPSAFVTESEFKDSNQNIHTSNDVIAKLDFDHMKEHAKMTLAFAYELAFAKL